MRIASITRERGTCDQRTGAEGHPKVATDHWIVGYSILGPTVKKGMGTHLWNHGNRDDIQHQQQSAYSGMIIPYDLPPEGLKPSGLQNWLMKNHREHHWSLWTKTLIIHGTTSNTWIGSEFPSTNPSRGRSFRLLLRRHPRFPRKMPWWRSDGGREGAANIYRLYLYVYIYIYMYRDTHIQDNVI